MTTCMALAAVTAMETLPLPDSPWAQLGQYGLLGIVLAWLMFRNEKQLSELRRNMETLSRSMLLLTISIPHADAVVKDQATIMLKQLGDK